MKKSNKNIKSSNHYISHVSGFWAMYKFLNSYLKHGYKYETSAGWHIELGSFYSQHVGFGAASKLLANRSFLSFSSPLFNAISLMDIKKISYCKKEQRIFIVFNVVAGDGQKWPDIASFGLSFFVAKEELMNIVLEDSKIDIKSHHFGEDNELIIAHKRYKTVSFEVVDDITQVIEESELFVRNSLEILDHQLQENLVKYDAYIPEFKGTLFETEEAKELKKKGFYSIPQNHKNADTGEENE